MLLLDFPLYNQLFYLSFSDLNSSQIAFGFYFGLSSLYELILNHLEIW